MNRSLSAAYGQLLFRCPEYGNFYFRSNCLNRFIGLGWFNKNYSTELQWDFFRRTEGAFELPLFIRFGVDRKLADNSCLNVRLNLAKEWWATAKWDLTLNENIKLSLQDRISLCAPFCNPAKSGYEFGATIEFKL